MRIHLRKRKGQLSEAKVTKGQKQMLSLYLAFQAPGKKIRYQWLELYVYESPKTNLEKECMSSEENGHFNGEHFQISRECPLGFI
jgi:hypothetical protein